MKNFILSSIVRAKSSLILLILLLILGGCSTPFVTTRGSYTFCYKGFWSPSTSLVGSNGNYKVTRNRDGNGCYVSSRATGTTVFSFKMDNYTPPSKGERKRHQKSEKFFEYTGTVSYYVSDQYPTAEDFAKASEFVLPDPRKSDTPYVMRTTSALIMISPHWIEDCPNDFVVFFDDIAVAIAVDWG